MDASSLENFERVLTAIPTHDSQVLKSVLKKLYLFLTHLSDLLRNWSNCRAPNYEGIKIQNLNYTVNFSDIFSISAFIFTELSQKFKPCLSNTTIAQSGLHLESWATQDFILLLRCCLGILPLLEVEPVIFIEKCRILLTLLRKLFSPDLSLDYSDSPASFLCSVIEVFMDELLAHKQLRKYFILVDDVSFTNEKLFKHHLYDGDNQIDVVLEVICAHLILSAHDESARKEFLDISVQGEKSPRSELHLAASVELLAITLCVSAPYTFQAHLISMVSKCISTDRDSDCLREKAILLTQYTTAFEVSFILYARHISCLKVCGSVSHYNSFISKRVVCCPALESFIRPITYKRVNQAANSRNHGASFSFKTKSEFLSASEIYIKENQQILNNSHKEEIMIVLNSFISQSLGGVEGNESHRDASQEEIYLIASILNLMSNSLLKIIQCTSDGSLKNQSLCKEYDFIINTISCLLVYVDEKVLEEAAGSNSTSRKESKQMMMHIAGFLRFCYDKGNEYLWKGCILTMMTLANLIVFEDGNLDELKAFVDSAMKPSKVLGLLSVRKSSLKIASKFEKAQRKNSGNVGEMCSGEKFLKLNKVNQDDVDDLADFIDCSTEKNYEKYVQDREKYRIEKFAREKSLKRKGKKKKAVFGKLSEMRSLFS